MLNVPSSRQILGTPFYLFALPILTLARIVNRGRIPLVKYDDEAVRSEWVTKEWCFDCADDTDHTYIEFRDEPVVEAECSHCGVITVHEDRVE